MSKENNLGKGLLFGFLTGSIIGAAVALLYAPKTGKELRKDIKVKKDELVDEAEKLLHVAKEKASDAVNEGKKKSEQLIANAKVKADELLKDAEKIFHDAKVKTSEAIEHGKETVQSETGKFKSAVKAGVDAYNETKTTS
ncbi:MAG: gas vesicle protein [Chlorobiaceae bacterium]|nr:gas vesicle protein [Chlorobiaceae bacterium]MBA4310004.1 gas vesicle protein [Chlorobiaceae bacterium]